MLGEKFDYLKVFLDGFLARRLDGAGSAALVKFGARVGSQKSGKLGGSKGSGLTESVNPSQLKGRTVQEERKGSISAAIVDGSQVSLSRQSSGRNQRKEPGQQRDRIVGKAKVVGEMELTCRPFGFGMSAYRGSCDEAFEVIGGLGGRADGQSLHKNSVVGRLLALDDSSGNQEDNENESGGGALGCRLES